MEKEIFVKGVILFLVMIIFLSLSAKSFSLTKEYNLDTSTITIKDQLEWRMQKTKTYHSISFVINIIDNNRRNNLFGKQKKIVHTSKG